MYYGMRLSKWLTWDEVVEQVSNANSHVWELCRSSNWVGHWSRFVIVFMNASPSCKTEYRRLCDSAWCWSGTCLGCHWSSKDNPEIIISHRWKLTARKNTNGRIARKVTGKQCVSWTWHVEELIFLKNLYKKKKTPLVKHHCCKKYSNPLENQVIVEYVYNRTRRCWYLGKELPSLGVDIHKADEFAVFVGADFWGYCSQVLWLCDLWLWHKY